jgi:hypothetical protein
MQYVDQYVIGHYNFGWITIFGSKTIRDFTFIKTINEIFKKLIFLKLFVIVFPFTHSNLPTTIKKLLFFP